MSHTTQSHKKTYRTKKKSTFFQKYRQWIGLAIVMATLGSFIAYETLIKEDFVPLVEGAPSAQVSRTSVNHGDQHWDQPVESKFEIRNVGDKQLMILNNPIARVIEGCCPPKVAIDRMEIDPGETATVSMNYTMHEGMDGKHELQIQLITNDPLQPEITLTAYSNWIR